MLKSRLADARSGIDALRGELGQGDAPAAGGGLAVPEIIDELATTNLATGRLERTRAQLAVASVGGLILVGMLAAAVASTTSTRVQHALRECTFCRHINCVEFSLFSEVPWWSCCLVGDSLGPLDESPGSPTRSCT